MIGALTGRNGALSGKGPPYKRWRRFWPGRVQEKRESEPAIGGSATAEALQEPSADFILPVFPKGAYSTAWSGAS